VTLAAERRAARERVLGLLYEAEAKGTTGIAVLAELPLAPDAFTVDLVRAVDEHRTRIDDLLSRFAQGWTLARMPALDRAALRMGTAELITRSDVPTGVVLSEVVELASRFSTDGSGRFVNGLLARIAEEVRPGATAPLGDAVEPPLVPQVDGLVIDLDGVIRHWDQAHIADEEARLGLPAGALHAAAFAGDRLRRAVDGRLPFHRWCEEIGADLAAAHGVDARDAGDAWATSTWHIDLRVMDLVAAVRERVPVVLLSNASDRVTEDLEHSGIADAFTAVVGSADIGVAKPEARAYQVAADRIHVPVDRCLFIDDTEANVEGARAVGMRAERFTDPDDLRSLLVELQLLP